MTTRSRFEYSEICRRIRRLAAEKALGRAKLAHLADVSGVLVYRVMRGQARLRDSTVGKFAKALDTSAEYLLTGEAPDAPPSTAPHIAQGAAPYGDMPSTVADAIALLAEQFGVPPGRLRDEIFSAVARLKEQRDESNHQ